MENEISGKWAFKQVLKSAVNSGIDARVAQEELRKVMSEASGARSQAAHLQTTLTRLQDREREAEKVLNPFYNAVIALMKYVKNGTTMGELSEEYKALNALIADGAVANACGELPF